MIEKLKIISADRIISFESPSQRRVEKLAQEIFKERKVRNPLLIYPLHGKYLMLDDISILKALKRLDVDHIPVQLADIERLSIHSWQRIVDNWYKKDLFRFCKTFPRQIRISIGPKVRLERQQAEIRFKDESIIRLSFLSDSYLTRAEMLTNFYKALNHAHSNFRAKLDIDDPDPLAEFPTASAAIYPPILDIIELAGMAARGICLPQGIVRVDQPGRLLGIDYSLSILRQKVSPEEKESFLKQLIRMRMSSDRTAYYNGFVYTFNN